MKWTNQLEKIQQTPTHRYFEDRSFQFVSSLLSESLTGNCQKIAVSAKAGDFLHDQLAAVDCPESCWIELDESTVIEREASTEISIGGSIKRNNGNSNKFSIFFSMKRKFLVIPTLAVTNRTTCFGERYPGLESVNGMLYNSIFHLSLQCVTLSGEKYSLGSGRGYLIFDKGEKI